MHADQLLAFINAHHHTCFRLLRRYTVGEWGAYALEDDRQRQFVLKWGQDGQLFRRLQLAVQITDRLRFLGWPIPHYICIGQAPDGVTYSVQEAVAGHPPEPLTRAHLEQLIALNELQAGQAVSSDQDWSAYIHGTVFRDVSGWAKTVQHYSVESATLLRELHAWTAGVEKTLLPHTDIVHSDFTTDNILFEQGKITAIIDWDAAGCGDRLLDATTLFFTEYANPAVRDVLQAYLMEHAGIDRVRIYLTHLIFGQLDWSIRHHPPPAVDHWITAARAVMRDL